MRLSVRASDFRKKTAYYILRGRPDGLKQSVQLFGASVRPIRAWQISNCITSNGARYLEEAKLTAIESRRQFPDLSTQVANLIDLGNRLEVFARSDFVHAFRGVSVCTACMAGSHAIALY